MESMYTVVRKFSLAMDQAMCQNAHKGDGWKECPFEYLIARMNQEMGEFMGKFNQLRNYAEPNIDPNSLQPGQLQDLKKEAADVANFLMMIVDKAGCFDE